MAFLFDCRYALKVYIANQFQLATNGRAEVASDADLDSLMACGKKNFVVIGGAEENKLTDMILTQQLSVPAALGITAGRRTNDRGNATDGSGDRGGGGGPYAAVGRIRVGPCNFEGRGMGVASLLPVVSSTIPAKQRLALVLAGTDAAGLTSVVELATPTIPPMVRSPFSNMLSDFVVTSREIKSLGAGGIVAAGYWGNSWEYRKDASFSAYCRRPTANPASPSASADDSNGVVYPDDLNTKPYLDGQKEEL